MNVPKMKPGGECEFWLTLNKPRHSLTERSCPDSETTTGKEAARVATARKQVGLDAGVLTVGSHEDGTPASQKHSPRVLA